uniref:Uncharacterized protein n=2 Tax=Oryza glumipatula TaxID=40148 RepID=A0A0E0B0B3_9ORYZ
MARGSVQHATPPICCLRASSSCADGSGGGPLRSPPPPCPATPFRFPFSTRVPLLRAALPATAPPPELAVGEAVKVMAAASQWTTFLVPLRPARVDLLPGNAGCRPSWLDLPALVYEGMKFCNGVVLGTIGVGAILRLLPQPTSTCLQGTSACTVYSSLRSYCEGGDISLQASVTVLKEVTKTRKVPVLEVPLALTKIKKANLETSSFFETLRGTEFPVRTWMRIFVKVRNRCMIACKSS